MSILVLGTGHLGRVPSAAARVNGLVRGGNLSEKEAFSLCRRAAGGLFILTCNCP